ncbi:tetratricopeptide repeat protein [Streptomyces durmitorensis]|uniref:Tetratricopeptide repeat protein n=1 Tax=Streptomyces durmitorensis TaxID=319947 RepID=A0ABY4PWT1_9ACTN|nr:tetratricopeptide repeat protein [Streptomyces durmitorensis]UQT58292.1 tetratricopeptide repeat protein [Streptomyces durmitorensis]
MEIETGSESVPQKEQRPPPAPAVWSESPRGSRRSPVVRRVLIASVAGCVVLGGVLVLRPGSGGKAAPPALGPAGRAMAAAGAGAPAALPDLTVLIGEREAHVRKHPGDDQSWAVLGAAYVERGLRTADSAYYPKAEEALRTSLKARPEGNADALTGMAVLANARHDFRGAKKWAESAVKLSPKRWSTYPALIDAYSGLGDAKGVGRALETLQELNSGAPAVMARSGQVYRDRGWREDAASKLMDAAALAEGSAEKAVCLYRVGELAWERGEPAEALRYYEAALRSDPDHHPSLAGKGRALAALGRTSEALRAYQNALVRQPAPEYALALGELYESLKLEPAARAQYDVLRARVKQEGVNGVNDERILGLFEADHGDADAAVERLRGEFKRHGSPEVADALGWALHRAGESEEGLKYATRATDKGPRSAVFAYHRGEIERELGRYGAARRHIGEALRLNPSFSPLLAPAAREALEALGDPPEGGPAQMYAPAPPPQAAPPASPRPSPTKPPQQG